MKDQETKQRFIQLRAEGHSYENIANELNVSKKTLLKWGHDFAQDINNMQYFIYQNMLEQFKMTKQEQIFNWFQEIKKIDDALEKKDYNELSKKDLIILKEKFENKILKEIGDITYDTEVDKDLSANAFAKNLGKEIIQISLQ